MWFYRDWVVDAFNRDQPFDQFTIEQLAGDLLPDATDETRLATAFHRNTMTNTEGGTDDEEFRVAAVKDRVDTTAQVWMALTLGCAKCHTHKFDPITHTEYFGLFAFLNNTYESQSWVYSDEQLKIKLDGDQDPSPVPLKALAARVKDAQKGDAATPVVIETVAEMRAFSQAARDAGSSVGFVPTGTPFASSAACLAAAVPDDPEMIAPA